MRLGSDDVIGGAHAACGGTTIAAPVPVPATSRRIVLGWNRLAVQAIRTQPSSSAGAPTAAQALAILHTSMYNAWAAYDDDARQTVHGIAVRLPRAERSAASKANAMSHAARLALGMLFPAQAAAFDARIAGLGLDGKQADGPFSPTGIGRAQACAMLDACRDGVPSFAPASVWAAIPAETGAGIDVDAAALRWCRLAHEVSTRDACDDDRDVLLYFVLANALADAGLAGADGGAAAAEVLRSFTGSDRAASNGGADGANGDGVKGDGAACFSAIAAQDGSTRTRARLAAGREVGAQVFDKARRYWQGKL